MEEIYYDVHKTIEAAQADADSQLDVLARKAYVYRTPSGYYVGMNERGGANWLAIKNQWERVMYRHLISREDVSNQWARYPEYPTRYHVTITTMFDDVYEFSNILSREAEDIARDLYQASELAPFKNDSHIVTVIDGCRAVLQRFYKNEVQGERPNWVDVIQIKFREV